MTERNTKQKQIVLEAVKARNDHPTADEIYSDVHEIDSHISRATVYRNLHQLSKNGEISAIDLVPDAGRYDFRTDRHHHMLCEVCGSVFDAPVEYSDSQDRKLEKMTGFRVRRHEVIFRGVCEKCLAEMRTRRGENSWPYTDA